MRGLISLLVALPVPLLLTGGGSRCAGYLAGRWHPGGRMKWRAAEAGWREKSV